MTADIFAPNASEAMRFTSAADVDDAPARLAQLTPLVVIKCGADGAVARQGARVMRDLAIPVDVVDTTAEGLKCR